MNRAEKRSCPEQAGAARDEQAGPAERQRSVVLADENEFGKCRPAPRSSFFGNSIFET